jgi:hypothetical protein
MQNKNDTNGQPRLIGESRIQSVRWAEQLVTELADPKHAIRVKAREKSNKRMSIHFASVASYDNIVTC